MGHGVKTRDRNCTSERRALTSYFSSLIVEFCSLVVDGSSLVVIFRLEGAPVVTTSATLGKRGVHAVTGL